MALAHTAHTHTHTHHNFCQIMAVSEEAAASSYAKRSGLQQDMGTKLMNMITIETGATVLDLGCGTGYLTKVLSEQVGPEGKVVAVDPDGERLKIAREKYSASNIKYIQADDKTFPSGQYDVVFANQVIHWIPDQKAVLKRVYDNLKLGGHFVFSTDIDKSDEERGEEYQLMDKLLGPGGFHKILSRVMTFLSADEYKSLISICGYSKMETETDTLKTVWETLDDVIDTAKGWLQGTAELSNVDEDVVRRVREECEQKDGPALTMTRTYLYVVLTK